VSPAAGGAPNTHAIHAESADASSHGGELPRVVVDVI
jgi:hypothetical protein